MALFFIERTIKLSKITFTPVFPVEKIFYPEPALKNIPEWYKKTQSFIDSPKLKINSGQTNATIKKCMPVFDAMTVGYIIKTYIDIYVYKDENNDSIYNWPSLNPISFHEIRQAIEHPAENGMGYPKWTNPWSIKTKKGYSCLFLQPMHHPNNFFTILPGIVDTDNYISPVNFPFTLNDPNFEGLIPAGTPMAQVIPFKRDSFIMEIGKEKQFKKFEEFANVYTNRWVNNYKNKFWQKKQYK